MSVSSWLESNPQEFAAWFAEQRWFGDKSRERSRISATELGSIAFPDFTVSIQIVLVSFVSGPESTYVVPLAQCGDEQPVDATTKPAFLAWLAAGFDGNQTMTIGDEGHRLEWRGLGADRSWTGEPSRLLSGEQSNTSVLYGDRAILKIFRKYQAGTNPDSEIVAFLTDQSGYRHVPSFLGNLVLVDSGNDESVELATVQALVPNDGDCWRWLPAALIQTANGDRAQLTAAIGLLGQRTGELHAALATGTDAAFRPEVYSHEDAEDFGQRLAREVKLTASMLFQHGALSHGQEEELVGGLISSVADADLVAGSRRIRIHGDYHLGQVLKTGGDFVIIDFEGEPSRPMAERRQKASPLKDVAGMLRSIDYACAAASHQLTSDDMASLRHWGLDASEVFVDQYRAAALGSSVSIVDRDRQRFDAVLDLFMTEKALYEVRYELDNRPDWLDIPLSALQRIASKR